MQIIDLFKSELSDRYYGADCLIYVPGNPTTWFKNVY
ncbi:hypothetical protein OROMI_009517 [Orobanche minor]